MRALLIQSVGLVVAVVGGFLVGSGAGLIVLGAAAVFVGLAVEDV